MAVETGKPVYWNFFGYRVNKIMLLLSAIHYVVLLIVNLNGGMFLSGNFQVEVPLPLDVERIPLYTALTNICAFAALFLLYQLAYLIYQAFRQKDKHKIYNFVLPFGALMAWYFINLKICWPGLYNIDDKALYALARHSLPMYWQSYLTSVFYMVGLWLVPMKSGQIVFLDILVAFVFAYFYYRLSQVMDEKKYKWWKLLLIALAVSPWVNLIALYAFRPYIYSMLNIAVFGFLVFEKLQQKKLDPVKFAILALGFAALAFWRSESIIYLFFAPFLLYFTYAGAIKVKQAVVFAVVTVLLYGAVNLPQSVGNKKYYRNDYLITSTARPLSVLLNLDGTYNYDGIERDIEKIDMVIDVNEIIGLPFMATSYMKSNSLRNGGHLSETMSTSEAQKEYISAFFNIIMHNKGAFLKERFDLFLKTNLLQGAYQVDFGQEIYQTLEKDIPPYWIFQAYLEEEGLSPGPVENADYFGKATFWTEHGMVIYAVWPFLLIIIVTLIFAAAKKSWLMFVIQLVMLLREGIIFLTSPDEMIYYYMPTVTLCLFISVLFLACGLYNSKAKNRVRLLS